MQETITITGQDLLVDERIHRVLADAYVNNQNVFIPNDLLKDFVEYACKRRIASESPFIK